MCVLSVCCMFCQCVVCSVIIVLCILSLCCTVHILSLYCAVNVFPNCVGPYVCAYAHRYIVVVKNIVLLTSLLFGFLSFLSFFFVCFHFDCMHLSVTTNCTFAFTTLCMLMILICYSLTAVH